MCSKNFQFRDSLYRHARTFLVNWEVLAFLNWWLQEGGVAGVKANMTNYPEPENMTESINRVHNGPLWRHRFYFKAYTVSIY